MNDGPIPPVGARVFVEATVVCLNYWPMGDEGPSLPVPCVKVRDGITFGVACGKLRRARSATSDVVDEMFAILERYWPGEKEQGMFRSSDPAQCNAVTELVRLWDGNGDKGRSDG